MNRLRFTLALCVGLILGASSLQVFARQREDERRGPRPAAARATTRWEYHQARLVPEQNLARVANQQAADGWEVVTVVPVNASPQFDILFRRAADAKE